MDTFTEQKYEHWKKPDSCFILLTLRVEVVHKSETTVNNIFTLFSGIKCYISHQANTTGRLYAHLPSVNKYE